LNTRDIEGTTSNSAFNRAHMMDVRMWILCLEKEVVQKLYADPGY